MCFCCRNVLQSESVSFMKSDLFNGARLLLCVCEGEARSEGCETRSLAFYLHHKWQGNPLLMSITNPSCQLESCCRTESKTSAENIWTRAVFNGREWEVVFIMCFRKWQACYCWVTNDWQPVFAVNCWVQNSNDLKNSLSLCSVPDWDTISLDTMFCVAKMVP